MDTSTGTGGGSCGEGADKSSPSTSGTFIDNNVTQLGSNLGKIGLGRLLAQKWIYLGIT